MCTRKRGVRKPRTQRVVVYAKRSRKELEEAPAGACCRGKRALNKQTQTVQNGNNLREPNVRNNATRKRNVQIENVTPIRAHAIISLMPMATPLARRNESTGAAAVQTRVQRFPYAELRHYIEEIESWSLRHCYAFDQTTGAGRHVLVCRVADISPMPPS